MAGVVQVGKGVAAVPQQVVAPMRGKWWNENEGRWVFTNMEKEIQDLQGVPEDDSDILGGIKAALDQGHTNESLSTEVVDTVLYDALEISPDADQCKSPMWENKVLLQLLRIERIKLSNGLLVSSSTTATIKRRYYVLARKYHPDKQEDGPGKAEATEKFKVISEAYHILSDPVLREKYNRKGRDALNNDPSELTPTVEPKVLFAFLFGSDKFGDIFGRLATATSTSVGDSEMVTEIDARKLQKRRVTRLASKLIERISPWLREAGDETNDESVISAWKEEAEELCRTSFGYPLVKTVGEAYYLLALQFQGSTESGQGLPTLSKWYSGKKAGMEQKRNAFKNKRKQFSTGLRMMDLQAKLKEEMEAARTDAERAEIAREAEEAATEILVRALWTTTVVDITSTLYETCQMVFFDQSVDKNVRKQRAKAVEQLGKVWMDIPEPPNGGEGATDYKDMYEEAALAAMMETLRRKGEGEAEEGQS